MLEKGALGVRLLSSKLSVSILCQINRVGWPLPFWWIWVPCRLFRWPHNPLWISIVADVIAIWVTLLLFIYTSLILSIDSIWNNILKNIIMEIWLFKHADEIHMCDYLTIYRLVCVSFNTFYQRQNGFRIQTTLSNVFSWMQMFEFRLKFHCSLSEESNQ